MNYKFFLLSLLFFPLIIYGSYSDNFCEIIDHGDSYCGRNCTGTPPCNGITCGNVANMCFCDCNSYECKTTDLGYKWNNGKKLANGSYALNGTMGDGKQYKC